MARMLSEAVDVFVRLLYLLIIIRVVLTFIKFSRRNLFVDIIYTLTEPLLAPVRALLRKSSLDAPGFTLDLSPFALYLFINLSRNIIVGLLI